MSSPPPVELADRMSRKRAKFTAVLAVLFVILQALAWPHFTTQPGDGVARRWGWVVLAVVVLLNLATGGGLLLDRRLRRLINDEISISHRDKALATGYWVAMIAALAVYGVVLAGWTEISAMQALHIVVTSSVAIALFAFSFLELRAHRDA